MNFTWTERHIWSDTCAVQLFLFSYIYMVNIWWAPTWVQGTPTCGNVLARTTPDIWLSPKLTILSLSKAKLEIGQVESSCSTSIYAWLFASLCSTDLQSVKFSVKIGCVTFNILRKISHQLCICVNKNIHHLSNRKYEVEISK